MEKTDWQINKSGSECNKYILDNELDCDISFKVGEDQEVIKAHKFILKTRSPVFDRMFNGGFKESESDPVIPDVSPAAFRALLRYCYYECLQIEGEVALSLLYTATKYMLPILEGAARKTLIQRLDSSKIWNVCKYSADVGDVELHKGCIEYLKGHLDSSNILDVVKYSIVAQEQELKDYCRKHLKENLNETNILDVTKYFLSIRDVGLHDACRNFLKKHLSASNIWHVYEYAVNEADTNLLPSCRQYFEGDVEMVKAALLSEEFHNTAYKVLLDVLHINDEVDGAGYSGYNPGISISEIELFKACNKWAEAQCLRQNFDPTGDNKRKVLGECLSMIRFPTMLKEDFMTEVYPTGILTEAGLSKLIGYMYRDPRVERQVDFPLQRRTFIVEPSGSFSLFNEAFDTILKRHMRANSIELQGSRGERVKCTVYIESGIRVLLTGMWTLDKNKYAVTLRDESTQKSWSTLYDTKDTNHVAGSKDHALHYIDIEPQVLEAGTRYSVSTECTGPGRLIPKRSGVHYITIQVKCSGYKGVKITRENDGENTIYALALSLV